MFNCQTIINKRNVIILSIIVVILGIIGLGIADAVIYDQGKEKTSRNEDCPTLPQNVTHIKLDKVFWYGWHRKYDLQDYPESAKVQQNCPSVKKDAVLFVNGKRVAQTDGKIATTKSKTYIKDCHGDIIYITKMAQSTWEIAVGALTLDISFEVSDADGNLLAYVTGSSFWKTE